MKTKLIKLKKDFVSRESELKELARIGELNESAILVVWGRRRVGKTELLEQAYRNRNILKFEGLQAEPQRIQMKHVLQQLAEYTGNSIFEQIAVDHWVTVLKNIANQLKEGEWTVYFEEVQWLADYKPQFISALKFVWDNYFRYNNKLLLILCGSSPSFMINQVVKSKALYNRSQYELPLKEFNLINATQLMPRRSQDEILDAYLTVGGIPEYLKRLNAGSSVFINLCQLSFKPGAYFLHEEDRIFASSLDENPNYRKIIRFLSHCRFATRPDIEKHLNISSGGSLTNLLLDLELCGFINKYTPYNLGHQSRLARYTVSDHYLQFFYKFIQPIATDIEAGRYINDPVTALVTDSYRKWLGFAFERFCRNYHFVIARILGFGSIAYRSGAYYNRATNATHAGFQFDLIYSRSDKVLTLCEIKYLEKPVGVDVIQAFENKLDLISEEKKRTIIKVLITKNGASKALLDRGYFDRIITLKDLFDPHYW